MQSSTIPHDMLPWTLHYPEPTALEGSPAPGLGRSSWPDKCHGAQGLTLARMRSSKSSAMSRKKPDFPAPATTWGSWARGRGGAAPCLAGIPAGQVDLSQASSHRLRRQSTGLVAGTSASGRRSQQIGLASPPFNLAERTLWVVSAHLCIPVPAGPRSLETLQAPGSVPCVQCP